MKVESAFHDSKCDRCTRTRRRDARGRFLKYGRHTCILMPYYEKMWAEEMKRLMEPDIFSSMRGAGKVIRFR